MRAFRELFSWRQLIRNHQFSQIAKDIKGSKPVLVWFGSSVVTYQLDTGVFQLRSDADSGRLPVYPRAHRTELNKRLESEGRRRHDLEQEDER